MNDSPFCSAFGSASAEAVDRGKEALQHPAREARREAEQGRGWYSWLARIGLVAKGISFGIVGVLAVKLALGDGGKATSREGALATLADESFGKVLLVLLALGFAAYAVWRFVQAFAERKDDESAAKGFAKTWGKRAAYIGRGVIYAGLAATTVKLLMNSSSGESQNERAQKHRDGLGLARGAVAGRPGRSRDHRCRPLEPLPRADEKVRGEVAVRRDERNRAEMGQPHRHGGPSGACRRLHVDRPLHHQGGDEYDPKEAIGLDGALRKLANTEYGPYLLGLTAVGLVCYGLYCFVDARYRDVSVGAGT